MRRQDWCSSITPLATIAAIRPVVAVVRVWPAPPGAARLKENRSVKDDTGSRLRPRASSEGESETLSGTAILAILVVIALVCTGGYFFLLKMIDVSRQDDCILAHRRNCGSAEVR
jgi:hypothetical protein